MKVTNYSQYNKPNEIFDLFKEGYLFHYNSKKDKFSLKTDSELLDILINALQNVHAIILSSDNQKEIYGFALYQFKKGCSTVLWIDELIIKSNYRHCGYGTIIMNELEKIAKDNKCNKIELCCWSFNTNASNFYNKLNYKEQRKILEKDI